MDRYKNCEYGPCLKCRLDRCILETGVVSRRHAQIKKLLDEGKTIAEIATELGTSIRTVYRVCSRG